LFLVLCISISHAQEFGAYAGSTDTDDHTSASYSWEMEYRQRLLGHVAASFSYLNEGHLPGHHRDGIALQAWAVTPRWLNRFELAFGIGPYIYFDTQTDPMINGFHDAHGVGEIYTGSATYSSGPRWFTRLNLSEIHTPGNENTRTLVLGFGYRFDDLAARMASASAPDAEYGADPLRNEITGFIGQTTINSGNSTQSTNFGLEYRRRTGRHVEFSTSWLNEADGVDGRHNGVTGELWLVNKLLNDRFVVGIGAGPYFAIEEHRLEDGTTAARVVGLASITLAWQVTPAIAARAVWHRGFTGDDQDRDILTFGVGWRW
jgi:hypothetical protein